MRQHARALLTVDEVRDVSHAFGLRRPIEAEPLGRGSRQSAKSRLRTPAGQYFLKRRAVDAAARLGFVHSFQLHLAAAGVPVAQVLPTLDGRTVHVAGGGAYELFRWIDGGRWSMRVDESAEVGAAIGALLRASASFPAPADAPRAGFHRQGPLAGSEDQVVAAVLRADPGAGESALRECVGRLVAAASRAHERAADAGLSRTPVLCVHGDLHPGNVLFADGRLRAILDFDGARVDHRACEVANALVHFGSHPIAGIAPEGWRPELDLARMTAVLAGTERAIGARLSDEERRALPWLMIESCTLESLVPVARTGRFAHLQAADFLPFIERKVAWIESSASSVQGL